MPLFIISTCRCPMLPRYIPHPAALSPTSIPFLFLIPVKMLPYQHIPAIWAVFCSLVDTIVQSTQMQVHDKRWKKSVVGNKVFADVKNPLRNFVEKTLPSIDLSQHPTRPTVCLDLSVGDPTTSLSFRTHPENLQSICKSVGRVDGYTNTQGLEGTRQAVVDKFAVGAFGTDKEDVFLCAGGSLAIWATMNLLGGEGDNFLFPSPGFPLALTIAKSMGLQPRFYHLQAGQKWSASLAEMEGLIDGRTRFIMVNDPSNPLGAAWSAEHKREILQFSKRHHLPILADEIYEDMTYAERVPTFAQLVEPQDAEEIAVFKCSGLTKRYLGPGWRMGWIILYASLTLREAYRPLLRGIFNVILMPNTVMQSAVPAILANPINEKRMQQCMGLMRANQQTLRQGLEGRDYCSFGYAAGALYATVLLELSKFGHQVSTTADFGKLLYAEQNVKVFPGEFFAGEVTFLRLVISCQHDNIVTFLERFHTFCQAHLLPK